MESFGEASGKETWFFLYLEKRKIFYTIILVIRFYYGDKKELLSVEFLLNKNLVKRDVVKHELQVERL